MRSGFVGNLVEARHRNRIAADELCQHGQAERDIVGSRRPAGCQQRMNRRRQLSPGGSSKVQVVERHCRDLRAASGNGGGDRRLSRSGRATQADDQRRGAVPRP